MDKTQVFSWTAWKKISFPKVLCRWGLKDLPRFAKALVAKCAWNVVSGSGLWNCVIQYKYISPLSVTEWIQVPDKSTQHSYIIWKAIVNSFDLIGGWLAWKIGNGRSVRIGQDLWVGGNVFK